ncbi:MAG: KpsF/GutQ family sugar-phosphate isomerase [Phycisphaeraceae bacterium]|nr:KpsF/GutQ family sugar-phosphate isomerase [Phycisphaeraceae bacterium]
MSNPDKASITDLAQRVLQAEAAAVSQIPIDGTLTQAVELVTEHTHAQAGGSIIVSGMGKCNFIAQKISATLASTGTPSQFLHPAEAMHGDLGRIRQRDVVVLLSHSGNTEEIITLAALLKQDDVPMIAITGNRESHLASLASVTLWIGQISEACPHNLAPTASTTAMLALGDALALCVSHAKDFQAEDFHKFHPGGSLGKQLMRITEAMRFKVGRNLPLIPLGTTLADAYAMSNSELNPGLRHAGAMLVIDPAGKLAGIFTDGDLRRLIISDPANAMNQLIENVMIQSPKHLLQTALVRDAVQMVRETRIDEIPVVDEHNKPVGLIDVQDLVALKVIES